MVAFCDRLLLPEGSKMKSQIEQLLKEAINMASEHDSHTSYVLNKVFICLSDNAITEAVAVWILWRPGPFLEIR
jgi:hypothetical protein